MRSSGISPSGSGGSGSLISGEGRQPAWVRTTPAASIGAAAARSRAASPCRTKRVSLPFRMLTSGKVTDLRAKLRAASAGLVAVSKTRSPEEIMRLYGEGQRDFGENRVQELTAKAPQLPDDVRWHMIGKLQRNKVKYIAPFVHLIHSVDSARLATAIEKEAAKAGRTLPVLLQVHIAREETKHGFDPDEVRDWLASGAHRELDRVAIRGLMGMATLTADRERIRDEFRALAGLLGELRQAHFPDDAGFRELSMGMSSDWEIALEEGATVVRLGTLLFGPRPSSG